MAPDDTDTSLPSGRYILIYTRGACPTINGGWAASLRRMDGVKALRVKRIEGSVSPFASVNKMDLQAAISALQCLKQDEPEPIVVVSTSGYLIGNASRYLAGWKERGWKKRDGKVIENVDLWRELDEAATGRSIRWTTGDARDPELLEVTKRAQAAAAKSV